MMFMTWPETRALIDLQHLFNTSEPSVKLSPTLTSAFYISHVIARTAPCQPLPTESLHAAVSAPTRPAIGPRLVPTARPSAPTASAQRRCLCQRPVTPVGSFPLISVSFGSVPKMHQERSVFRISLNICLCVTRRETAIQIPPAT